MGKSKEFHNESKTDLYKKWSSMRCRVSPKWKNPEFYFLKGITICNEWSSFLVFKKWALENEFTSFIARLVIGNNNIIFDVDDFNEDMFPQDDHCHCD